MKSILIILALVLFLGGCHDKMSPVVPTVCGSTYYSRGRELINIQTVVLAKTSITPLGTITIYYIENPDAPGLKGPYAPCNLPEQFKKDKLAVRISAYQLTWPGMESQDYYGLPIELIRIEER